MKLTKFSIALLCAISAATPSAWGQAPAPKKPAAAKLTLQDFLKEVQENNPEGVALTKSVQAFKNKIDEAELQLSPYGYIEYSQTDDQKPTTTPAMQGDQTLVTNWRAGIKKQTTFGLSANLFVDSTDVDIRGIDQSILPPGFLPETKYNEGRAVLELRQSLWRNGFGQKIRNEVLAGKEANRAEFMLENFKLQQFLLNSEASYWALASLNQVIRLQEENIDRARKMRDLMQRRYGQKLVDDVDYMQTQVALQARELEWQNLVDEREALYRTFNTLRGVKETTTEFELDSLPTQEWLARQTINKNKHRRADFEALRSGAKAGKAKAKADRSNINPDLDVFASYASNGRDSRFSSSFREVGKYDYPTWTVGVSLNVPLDFGLTSDLREAYNSQLAANESKEAQAVYQEQRAFEDAFMRRSEAQVRYERMVELEKTQARMVEQERKRLSVGRTTTFQMINFEQDLASTQIQRVRAQLDLIQTHNQLKLFQESL